ncbi:putative holin-like toxin [Muricomes intestini]|nr:putative holin-like toxin [Muricomes intestini]
MNIQEAISLIISFGIFLIALLTYIDRINKRK